MVERVRVAALGNEQKTQLSQKLGVRLASWDFRQQGIQCGFLLPLGGGDGFLCKGIAALLPA